MATVHIALAYWTSVGQTNTGLAVPSSIPIDTQIIVSASTSKESSIECPGDPAGITYKAYHQTTTVWVLTVTGGAVYVKFGPAGIAATTPATTPSPSDEVLDSWLILDGQTRAFTAYPGHICTVIDAGS